MKACIFVVCWLGVNFVCADAYKGGVIDSSNNDVSDILPLIYEAGNKNVDVLVLSSDVINSEDNYEEIVEELSKAAKHAGLYLVTHLNEQVVCQKEHLIVRSNLVFDRQGSVVAVYRKPNQSFTKIANCTTPTVGLTTFNTDFGVTFGVMMEEDLVLKTVEGFRNFVVTGTWASEIPFLSASQFASAWAYTANANVLSRNGIFAGRAGIKACSGQLAIAELKNNANEGKTSNPPVVTSASIQDFPGEDLSQYIIRPLDVDASSEGYKESVCHNGFCCEFSVKTGFKGSKQNVNYGLAAFDGIRHFGSRHYIGTQSCAVFACAGLYKRTCNYGSVNNNTNMAFEKLTITANFTIENSIQYPVILSNEHLASNKFNFVTKTDKNIKQVTIGLTDSDNLLTFGIFGRDFENDYESSFENIDGGQSIYDYIFTEDLQEFFDYVWIRLRILIIIVSIYVLEMM